MRAAPSKPPKSCRRRASRKSGGTNIRLASLAAARQWRFRPAMAGGKAVPADLTLVFDF